MEGVPGGRVLGVIILNGMRPPLIFESRLENGNMGKQFSIGFLAFLHAL